MIKKHFFIGGPVSQINDEEKEFTRERFNRVRSFIESLDHSCYCAIPDNSLVNYDEQGRPKIATIYMKKAKQRVIDTIRSFRAGDIQYSIGYWYWTLQELERADACIWVLTRPSTGSGAEIAWMLRSFKHCLVFFGEKESYTVNGIVDRNLITAYWDENTYEDVLGQFISKVLEDRNRTLSIRLNNDEMKLLDAYAAANSENRSDLIRRLLKKEFESGGG